MSLGEFVLKEPSPDVAVLELVGEHDLHTLREGELRSTLKAIVEAHGLVVMDITAATLLDSSIFSALLTASRRAAELGHPFRVQVGGKWEAKLRVTGLTDVLEIGLSRDDVLASPRRTLRSV